MVQTIFTYPATLELDEDGRPVVSFPDLPGAVTDGADETEALTEAADCLSEALATRISHGEEIPSPSRLMPGQHFVSPDPTIALKAALYMAMFRRGMTVADLGQLLDMDWHLAARLIDPKRSSKLVSLAEALGALGCRIAISVEDHRASGDRSLPAASISATARIAGTGDLVLDRIQDDLAARIIEDEPGAATGTDSTLDRPRGEPPK
jgi:antitoxin HicB